MMIFFIPGSGGKNGIVISLIDVLGKWGEWYTLLICIVVFFTWILIFNWLFKDSWPTSVVGERCIREDKSTGTPIRGQNKSYNNSSHSGSISMLHNLSPFRPSSLDKKSKSKIHRNSDEIDEITMDDFGMDDSEVGVELLESNFKN